MDDELLKLECLKMARETGHSGADLTREAQRLFDFLKGRGQTDLVGGGKARVVGKDSDIPFSDYNGEWPTNKRGVPKLFVSDAQADRFIRDLGMSEDDFVRMKTPTSTDRPFKDYKPE